MYWREAKTEPEKVLERLAKATAEADAEAEITRVQAANKAIWPFLEGDLESAAWLRTLPRTTLIRTPDLDSGGRRTRRSCCGA